MVYHFFLFGIEWENGRTFVNFCLIYIFKKNTDPLFHYFISESAKRNITVIIPTGLLYNMYIKIFKRKITPLE